MNEIKNMEPIRKLKKSQRHHIKTYSKVETNSDYNQTLVMPLKENELQANIDEVELWKDGIKPHKSEVYHIKFHIQVTQASWMNHTSYAPR